MKRLISSFLCAFCGIIKTFASERNFRIHSLIAAMVIIFGMVFRIRPYEWALVILCIALVMAMECMNTAIEKTVDMISKEYSTDAKFIKDASAAAVLIAAISSSVIGGIVFFKYFTGIFR